MSALMPFVRAFRALGHALEAEALPKTSEARGEFDLVRSIGRACHQAATDLEQQIAADLSRTGAER
jgi:hypothetical protein